MTAALHKDPFPVEAFLREAGVAQNSLQKSLAVLQQKGWLPHIVQMKAIDSGMTNRLFYFTTETTAYLLRIPGEGSEYLVDRQQESWIYHKLENTGITDPFVYLDPVSGIKITEYIADAHCCDPRNNEEVRRCIRHLAHFHNLKLQGKVYFDLFRKLEDYESRCAHDIREFYPDYDAVRGRMRELKQILDARQKEYCICHVDPVPDNFLIREGKIYLIDWEYAAMADPHMDIAMFCIYAGYDKEQIDRVIGFYFKEGCSDEIRQKIYCYVAISGLLWTVWCEIKRDSGVLFEEYARSQYRYAIDYYSYAMEMERSPEKKPANAPAAE